MKSTISGLAALVYLIPGIMALTINTPFGVTQCQPQMISWSDGAPPYYVSIIPGGQPSAAPLRSWDPQTGSSLTWQVDLPSGTSITLAIKDSTGNTAFSDKVNVQPASPGTACSQNADALATTADTSPAAGTTGAAGAPSGTSSGNTSRPTSTSGSSGNSNGSQSNAARPASSTPAVAVGTSSNAARPSPTNNSSGAVSNLRVGSFGVAGVASLVAAFFL
ncbi:hypothetical protein BJ165DRAFT_1526144 [Panaeolus papilionaceus]|nr:hypothetical protein BJ165DRAFT_1526144 [Panaeolus papilionaceus]